MSDCRYGFVISTGRCGTTLLGNLLNRSGGVLALNEGQIRREDLSAVQIVFLIWE